MNKSGKKHPTKQQLYGHLLPISKTIQKDEQDMQDTAGEVRTNSFSNGPLQTDVQVLDHQLELIYNSSVRTQYVV